MENWIKHLLGKKELLAEHIPYKYVEDNGFPDYKSYGSKAVNFDVYKYNGNGSLVVINSDSKVQDVYKANCVRELVKDADYVLLLTSNLNDEYNLSIQPSSIMGKNTYFAQAYRVFPYITSSFTDTFFKSVEKIQTPSKPYMHLKIDDPVAMLFGLIPGESISFETIFYDFSSPVRSRVFYTVV